MQSSHAIAQRRQVSLISAWLMHSSLQARHIAMQASSIGRITIGSMLIGRISIRIIVVHMSAQLAHIEAQRPMPSMPAIASEHIVHACMQAEHASMQACIAVMSIVAVPLIGIAFIMSSLVPMSLVPS